jgi:hypothetical protein
MVTTPNRTKRQKTRADVKSITIAAAMLVILCGLAVTGRAMITGQDEGPSQDKGETNVQLVSAFDFEPIRADILNDSPRNFTIDVKKIANMGVNEDAPVFAVYTESHIPKKCADFRELKISYQKPSKYKRVFDLSQHEDVLKALKAHNCIVMRNIPPAAG